MGSSPITAVPAASSAPASSGAGRRARNCRAVLAMNKAAMAPCPNRYLQLLCLHGVQQPVGIEIGWQWTVPGRCTRRRRHTASGDSGKGTPVALQSPACNGASVQAGYDGGTEEEPPKQGGEGQHAASRRREWEDLRHCSTYHHNQTDQADTQAKSWGFCVLTCASATELMICLRWPIPAEFQTASSAMTKSSTTVLDCSSHQLVGRLACTPAVSCARDSTT